MRSLGLLVLVAGLVAGAAPAAHAVGFGFYGTAGKGTVRVEDWGGAAWGEETSREDAEFIGGGMVLDTAVAIDRIFNYRLNVGYEKLRVEFDGEDDPALRPSGIERLESLVIDQDFGVGLYRSPRSRLWFGPELRLLFASGDWGMGIGPVLGLNLHGGREVSTALKIGFLFTEFAGDGWFLSGDYEKESHAFLNFAILFRSAGDRHREKRSAE